MASNKSRESGRASIQLVARYRSPSAFEFVTEECLDVSSGGMFVRSEQPAPVGTLLKLECETSPSTGETLRAVARVAWIRESASEGPTGMGVKFVKLEGDGQAALEQLLSRLEPALDPEGAKLRGSVAPGSASIMPSARPSAKAPSIAPTAATPSFPPGQERPPTGAHPNATGDGASGEMQAKVGDQAGAAEVIGEDERREDEASEGAATGSAMAAVDDVSTGTNAVDVAADDEISSVHAADANEDPALLEPVAQTSADAQSADETQISSQPPAAADTAMHAMDSGNDEGGKPSDSAGSPAQHGSHGGQPWTDDDATAQDSAETATDEHADGDVSSPMANEPATIVSADALHGTRGRKQTSLPPEETTVSAPQRSSGSVWLAVAAVVLLGGAIALQMSKSRHRAAATPATPAAAAASPAAAPTTPAAAPMAPTAEAEQPSAKSPEALSPNGEEAVPTEAVPGAGDAPKTEEGAASAHESDEAAYLLEVETNPAGAEVQVGEQSVTAPAQVELSALAEPLTVRAELPGHDPTATTVEAGMFKERDGKRYKKITLRLTKNP